VVLVLIAQYHYDTFVPPVGGIFDSSQPSTSPPPTPTDKRGGGIKTARKRAKGVSAEDGERGEATQGTSDMENGSRSKRLQ
jgi:hypothetical protein